MYRGVCCDLLGTCGVVSEYAPAELEGPERWPWLTYALCCRTSAVCVPAFEIYLRGALTRSDMLAISAVLETNYPQPMMKSNGEGSHVYGFVDIREGAVLYPTGIDGDNGARLVSSSTCRCRALYDATDSVSWVNVVVPGYGFCRAKLGEELKFIPDSGQLVFREKKRVCGSLAIIGGTFETPAVLVEVLTLVFVRYYCMVTKMTTSRLGFTSTCAHCLLHAQSSRTTKYTVVVSAHDESLRCWPIKTINLPQHSGTVPDLTGCLRNPKLRTAQELFKLDVTAYRCEFDEEEMRELNAFDGAFLPVIKEMLPKSSKAALISVVTSASNATKQINCLDVYILSLIFMFASTPDQRSVQCYCPAFWSCVFPDVDTSTTPKRAGSSKI